MPEYEGFVASLKEDGKAEVLLRHNMSGVVGAPGVSAKVCHCASNGSQVTLEALNPLRAAVGDWVAVRVETSAVMRNAGFLIGIPILALALGWVVSLLLGESYLFGVPAAFLCVFCSLPLGVVAGVLLYKRWSKGALPMITRVIQPRKEMIPPCTGCPLF